MVIQSQEVSARRQESSRREERAHRILDAAAALIMRWGYNKTTIDDIARQAGVAKGTIYLHWKTREDLFAALIQREGMALGEDFKRRIATDPVGATLQGIYKHTALALLKRPLLKALVLRDVDVLGKLARSQQTTAAYVEKLTGFKTYIELLREHGQVRTDISLKAQVYVVSAILTGFFVVAPLLPVEYALSDDEMADLIGETVRCTLESGRAASPDGLQAASHAFMQYVNRAMTVAEEQLQRELDS
ncbi:MAG: TetR/AcrR family transcriptional regulator [Chloroflexi bacterium]|nr:TetR/AcrR family transcriptional regulator [Chloroflexota bacterium]